MQMLQLCVGGKASQASVLERTLNTFFSITLKNKSHRRYLLMALPRKMK